MSILNILLKADPAAVADTVKHASFSQKLESLSGMSPQEIIGILLHGTLEVVYKIIVALIVFFIGRWLIRYIRSLLSKMMVKRNIDRSLQTFVQSLVKITLTLILVITIISVLGIDTTSFVALFASAGLAVGMALSGTLQNFAGGVMILMFKPFRVGDFIEAQGQNGTVKEIQLFNTILNTADNKTIMVPNGGISTGIINNYSHETKRRVDWTFGIGYGDDYDLAKATLTELLAQDKRIMTDPPYFIALHSLADSSVNIVVRAWAKTEDYWGVYFDMNEKVYKTFPKKGLNIPFPQMDVHVYPENAAKES